MRRQRAFAHRHFAGEIANGAAVRAVDPGDAIAGFLGVFGPAFEQQPGKLQARRYAVGIRHRGGAAAGRTRHQHAAHQHRAANVQQALLERRADIPEFHTFDSLGQGIGNLVALTADVPYRPQHRHHLCRVDLAAVGGGEHRGVFLLRVVDRSGDFGVVEVAVAIAERDVQRVGGRTAEQRIAEVFVEVDLQGRRVIRRGLVTQKGLGRRGAGGETAGRHGRVQATGYRIGEGFAGHQLVLVVAENRVTLPGVGRHLGQVHMAVATQCEVGDRRVVGGVLQAHAYVDLLAVLVLGIEVVVEVLARLDATFKVVLHRDLHARVAANDIPERGAAIVLQEALHIRVCRQGLDAALQLRLDLVFVGVQAPVRRGVLVHQACVADVVADQQAGLCIGQLHHHGGFLFAGVVLRVGKDIGGELGGVHTGDGIAGGGAVEEGQGVTVVFRRLFLQPCADVVAGADVVGFAGGGVVTAGFQGVEQAGARPHCCSAGQLVAQGRITAQGLQVIGADHAVVAALVITWTHGSAGTGDQAFVGHHDGGGLGVGLGQVAWVAAHKAAIGLRRRADIAVGVADEMVNVGMGNHIVSFAATTAVQRSHQVRAAGHVLEHGLSLGRQGGRRVGKVDRRAVQAPGVPVLREQLCGGARAVQVEFFFGRCRAGVASDAVPVLGAGHTERRVVDPRSIAGACGTGSTGVKLGDLVVQGRGDVLGHDHFVAGRGLVADQPWPDFLGRADMGGWVDALVGTGQAIAFGAAGIDRRQLGEVAADLIEQLRRVFLADHHLVTRGGLIADQPGAEFSRAADGRVVAQPRRHGARIGLGVAGCFTVTEVFFEARIVLLGVVLVDQCFVETRVVALLESDWLVAAQRCVGDAVVHRRLNVLIGQWDRRAADLRRVEGRLVDGGVQRGFEFFLRAVCARCLRRVTTTWDRWHTCSPGSCFIYQGLHTDYLAISASVLIRRRKLVDREH